MPWELSLGYTFFRATDTQNAIGPAGGLLWPTQTVPGIILTVDNGTATSRWNYNLYDLELGRDFAIDTALTLRMLGGMSVASIGLDSTVLYDGRDANLAAIASGFDFTGAGVMVGGETHWTFGPRLSLFGRARGGMMFGVNNSSFRETNNAGATVDADITHARPRLCRSWTWPWRDSGTTAASCCAAATR